MTPPSDRTSILIVDDQERVADAYRLRLQGEYAVDVATGGREGLELVDNGYDVVLLDRRMPDFDIIDVQCDDYVVKPLDESRLREVVERALKIAEYSDRRQELGSKKLKRNVLEVEMSEAELEGNAECQHLETTIRDLESTVDELEDELGLEDVDRFL